MSETMRAAWIGVAGALLGVILTLVVQPILNERLGPRREGIFSVEQTCLSSKNLDPTIATQVVSYPCQLRLAHIEGPAVSKLSVSLSSQYSLTEVRTERNDENVVPSVTAGAHLMTVDVPTLRQGSVIDVRFLSNGDPHIEKNIVRENGQILSNPPSTYPRSWYEEWWGAALILGGIIAFTAFTFFALYKYVLQPIAGPLPYSRLAVALLIGLASLLPIIDIGSFIQTVLLLTILHVVSTRIPVR